MAGTQATINSGENSRASFEVVGFLSEASVEIMIRKLQGFPFLQTLLKTVKILDLELVTFQMSCGGYPSYH